MGQDDQQEVKTVIAHLDMDAFYSQVEQGRDPSLKGMPVGVVQYNPHGDLRTVTPDEPRRVDDSNGKEVPLAFLFSFPFHLSFAHVMILQSIFKTKQCRFTYCC